MKTVLSSEVMKKSDAYTAKNLTDSKTLMLRAGTGIAEAFCFYGRVAVICGSGNNAGDGYVLSLILLEKGIDVSIFLISDKFSPDGAYYYEKCVAKGIKTEKCNERTDFSSFDIIVDCIFGTGFHGDVSGLALTIIDKINGSGKKVVSADINSGLDSDSGMTEKCVKSSLTVSVGFYKYGHFLGMGKDVIGGLCNVDIGMRLCGKCAYLPEREDFLPLLSKRINNSNKGSYGYVGIMGGCTEYSGAVKLANMSLCSLRSGAGVSRLIVPESVCAGVMPYLLESTLFPFPDDGGHMIFSAEKTDDALSHLAALSVGMGWGISSENEKILRYILENYSVPLLIDADGINTVSRMDKNVLKSTECRVVLTPHPKEFERLSGIPVKKILENPVKYAEDFAADMGVILLLKGASTIVTDGDKTYIVNRGCAGMATAGSGDVLSGVITGLLGYLDYSPLTVSLGAYIAGVAGEYAEKENTDISMISSDTAKNIPRAVKFIRGEDLS